MIIKSILDHNTVNSDRKLAEKQYTDYRDTKPNDFTLNMLDLLKSMPN